MAYLENVFLANSSNFGQLICDTIFIQNFEDQLTFIIWGLFVAYVEGLTVFHA